MTFPFSGGLNGDDPVPDPEFEDLFDDEDFGVPGEFDDENTLNRNSPEYFDFESGPGMSREDLGGDAAWSDGFDD